MNLMQNKAIDSYMFCILLKSLIKRHLADNYCIDHSNFRFSKLGHFIDNICQVLHAVQKQIHELNKRIRRSLYHILRTFEICFKYLDMNSDKIDNQKTVEYMEYGIKVNLKCI